VVHPVRHLPAGHALHRDGEAVARLGGAGHGVAPDDVLLTDRRAEGAVLSRDVGKAGLERRRDLENERPRVGGLVDHLGHRPAVEALFWRHRAPGMIGRRRAFARWLSSVASTILVPWISAIHPSRPSCGAPPAAWPASSDHAPWPISTTAGAASASPGRCGAP